MPRTLRIHEPGGIYHVMLRGNNKQNIFLSAEDSQHVCFLLKIGLKHFDHQIFGFCLMSNHIHLIIQSNSISLSRIIHHFASLYAHYFNEKYRKVGHLFQGRFKSILITNESYLIELIRYVHLNPVRAGITKFPENYLWSSHLSYSSNKNPYYWVNQAFILKKFHTNINQARELYIEYITRGIGQQTSDEFLNECVRGILKKEDERVENEKAEVVREEDVKEEMGNNNDNVNDDKENVSLNSKLKKETPEFSIENLLNLIAQIFEVPVTSLIENSKNQNIVKARGLAAIVVRNNSPLTLKELAVTLGKNSDYLSRLANATENKLRTDEDLACKMANVKSLLYIQ